MDCHRPPRRRWRSGPSRRRRQRGYLIAPPRGREWRGRAESGAGGTWRSLWGLGKMLENHVGRRLAEQVVGGRGPVELISARPFELGRQERVEIVHRHL